MKLKNGTLVNYTVGEITGTGRIIGVASQEMACVGYIYIVLDCSENFPNDVYEYDAFAVPESLLEVLK